MKTSETPLTPDEIRASLLKQGVALFKIMGMSPTETAMLRGYIGSEIFLGWLGYKLTHTKDEQCRQAIRALMKDINTYQTNATNELLRQLKPK